MTPVVDRGELQPRCWACHELTGNIVTIHERELQELERLDLVKEGWRLIDEMNQLDDGDS